MSDRDPLRFSDKSATTPAVLKHALRAARGRGPSAAALSSLAAKLPIAKGAVAPTIKIVASGSTSLLPAILIGAGLGVVVSAVGLFWPSAPAPKAEVSAPIVAPAKPTAIAITIGPSAIAPGEAVGATTAPAATVAPSAAAPAKSAATTPRASTSSSAEAAVDSAPGSLGASPPPADLATEAHLLSLAQAELGANPAKALALTEEHVRKFPGGSLGQEREVVAIQALKNLGRTGEARARVERFLSSFPGSAHRRRIEALLAP